MTKINANCYNCFEDKELTGGAFTSDADFICAECCEELVKLKDETFLEEDEEDNYVE